MSLDPTGIQIHLTLERGGRVVTADVGQVGAVLRGVTVDGVDLVARFPEGTPAPSCSGTVLVPWPNRISDGKWTYDGTEQLLAVTEPKLDNAIHGLLRYTAYVVSESDSAVTLRANVVPQLGYPFLLETAVTYALTSDGVTVTHVIRNSGAQRAPIAVGTHPFITVGNAPASDLTVTSTGSEYIVVDDRLLPVGTAPVTDELDLRSGRVLGDLHLDTAYASLAFDDDGRARHRVTDRDGNSTVLWQDEQFGYVQFYTGRNYPGQDVALACEPMTAPADAFNSGEGLIWLEPGDTFTGSWGIVYESAA